MNDSRSEVGVEHPSLMFHKGALVTRAGMTGQRPTERHVAIDRPVSTDLIWFRRFPRRGSQLPNVAVSDASDIDCTIKQFTAEEFGKVLRSSIFVGAVVF